MDAPTASIIAATITAVGGMAGTITVALVTLKKAQASTKQNEAVVRNERGEHLYTEAEIKAGTEYVAKRLLRALVLFLLYGFAVDFFGIAVVIAFFQEVQWGLSFFLLGGVVLLASGMIVQFAWRPTYTAPSASSGSDMDT
jgi:hypothetical protein